MSNRTRKTLRIPEHNQDGTIRIFLTLGYSAVIDAIDEDLAKYNWHTVLSNNSFPYAFRSVPHNDSPKTAMHRLILERALGRVLQSDEEVDHWDRNTTNNTRGNLRLATTSQNMGNRIWNTNASGYKGVTRHSTGWAAAIQINLQAIYLGLFDTEELAGIAYNHAAKEHFGEFALVNPIPDWERINPRPRDRRHDNKSGFTGVFLNKQKTRWVARVRKDGKTYRVGTFNTPEEAHEARCKFLEELNDT